MQWVTMWRARTAMLVARIDACRGWLVATLILGGVFLVIQGSEWVRLIRYGLRISSGTYGGMFYSVIGVHAVHVIIAVVVLAVVLCRARRARYDVARRIDVEVAHLFWTFVVAVWPMLYVLVYLL